METDLEKYLLLIDFAKLHKTEAFLLGSYANSIKKKNTSTVNIPSTTFDIIAGFINQEPLPFFKEDYYGVYFYSCYALEEYLNTKEYENAFLTLLKKPSLIDSRTLINGRHYNFFKLLLVNAVQLYDIDVCKLIADNRNEIASYVKHTFFEVFPYVNPLSDYFFAALEISTANIKVEDNYLSLYPSLLELSYQFPSIGEQIILKYQDVEGKDFLLVPFCFIGLTRVRGIDRTFQIVEEFLACEEPTKQILGIRCLIALVNHDRNKVSGNYLQLIFEKCDNLILEGNEKVLAIIINFLGLFFDEIPSTIEKVSHIVKEHKYPEVLFSLSHILWLNVDQNKDKVWFNNLLFTLSAFDGNLLGIFNKVNWILENVNEELAYRYLEAYILNPQNSINNFRGFKSSLRTLASKSPELLKKKITLWLNNDNSSFHKAVAEVCNIIWLEGTHEIALDKDIIDSLNDADIVFISHKILGYIDSKEHLQSLIFSIFKKKQISEELLSFETSAFAGYIAYNYPGTINYLENKRDEASNIEQTFINAVVESVNAYHEAKRGKPLELWPSSTRLQLLFNQNTKKISENIKEDKFKEPSFLDYVKKIDLKIGNGFFSRTGEFGKKYQYSPFTHMQHFEESFEAPSGEFIDPVGQAYNRYNWRMYQRSKI